MVGVFTLNTAPSNESTVGINYGPPGILLFKYEREQIIEKVLFSGMVEWFKCRLKNGSKTILCVGDQITPKHIKFKDHKWRLVEIKSMKPMDYMLRDYKK